MSRNINKPSGPHSNILTWMDNSIIMVVLHIYSSMIHCSSMVKK